MMAEYIVALFFVFLLALIFVCFVMIPIMIANGRGIQGTEKTTIVILSWLGLFFGITWVVALILSLVWGGSSCSVQTDKLEQLEKLAHLYKTKAITQTEYNNLKKKLLKDADK